MSKSAEKPLQVIVASTEVIIDRALLVQAITWLRGYSHNLRSRLQPETAEETLFVNEPNRIADEIVSAIKGTI